MHVEYANVYVCVVVCQGQSKKAIIFLCHSLPYSLAIELESFAVRLAG